MAKNYMKEVANILGLDMDIKIAELMLKFVEKVCNKHKGLNIAKYSKLSGEKVYKLEWYDCGDK